MRKQNKTNAEVYYTKTFVICLYPVCLLRFKICLLSSFWLSYIYWFANCYFVFEKKNYTTTE